MPLRTSQVSVLAAGAGAQGWQACHLTWYDPSLGGINTTGAANPHAATASGEPYDPNAMTCAAPPQYAFGTMITFRYKGATVTCRVNDRGGAIVGSHFDLSRGAATALGMISAGSVAASFAVGGNASSPSGSQTGSSGPDPSGGSGGPGGGGNLLSIITDILTLNLSDMAARLAIVGVTVIKDVAIGFGDYVIVPAWHWNQRAVMYYQQNVLFGQDPTPQMWTAAFWAFGYWLLWTAPGEGIKPQPVTAARLGKHVRTAQGVPARLDLIKPGEVRKKTPKKPKPVPSRVEVKQVGTLTTHRPERVRVEGALNDSIGGDASGETETAEPTAERTPTSQDGGPPKARNPESGEPHADHRTRSGSLPTRSRSAERAPAESIGTRIANRHRRTPRGSSE